MDGNSGAGFAALANVLRKRPAVAPGERCDFCGEPVQPEHAHLVDLHARRIMCACRPCALVFEPQGAARGRYKPIPTRYAEVTGLALDDAAWDALQIPIELAFFFRNSAEDRTVACYPGPAGATESQLPLATWDALAGSDPLVATLESDVEAIVVQRRRAGPARCYLVPIDAAYQLVGMLRLAWRGFDGGDEARAQIERWFAALAERSRGLAAPR